MTKPSSSALVIGALLMTVLAAGCARERPDPMDDEAWRSALDHDVDGGPMPWPEDGGTWDAGEPEDGGTWDAGEPEDGGTWDGGGPVMDGGMPGNPPGATNRCWNRAFTFYFNPALDAVLDNAVPAWNAAARLNAVTAAANDWNMELAALNSPVRINVVTTQGQQIPIVGQFAADWSNVLCMDNMAMVNVYERDFFNPDMHHGNLNNLYNTGSFGHQVPMAPAPRPNGVGWTGRDKPPYSMTDIEVLAETRTTPAPPAGGFISEADVIFHTHSRENMNCTRIPWAVGPQAGRYDFQSVALHELGHALGLDHIAPDGNNPGNVMRPAILTNQRLTVNAVEKAALRAMYGPGGPCAPPPGGQ